MVSQQQRIQTLTAIKPLLNELVGLLDVLGQLEQTKSEILDELSRYGISLLPGAFSLEQLQRILAAVQTTANRLWEIARSCGYSVSEPEAVFSAIFVAKPLDFRFNPEVDYASVSDKDVPGQQVVTLSPYTFVSPTTGDTYGNSIIEGIIIHELGHAFHNALEIVEGEATEYVFIDPQARVAGVDFKGNYEVTIPVVKIGEDTVFTNLTITVSGDTPLVALDYLIATGGYWAGNVGFDFGNSRNSGPYTASDASADPTSIVPLTKALYEATIGSSSCSDCPGTALVNRGGECIQRNGTCVTVDDVDFSQYAVYVRQPGYYQPGDIPQNRNTLIEFEDNFTNEFVPPGGKATTLAPQPIEGFADTFKVEITQIMDISTNKRGQFFNERWCEWLGQLLA